MGIIALWYLLFGAFICYAEWNDAKFEIVQNEDGISPSMRIHQAAAHMNPQFAAVKIDPYSMEGFGLTSNWSRNATFDFGYTYMVKTFARDTYDPPRRLYHNSYSDEVIYKTFIPGMLEVGSVVVIRLTPIDPWVRFAITFMDKMTNVRPFKMKIWNDETVVKFCYEIEYYEQAFEDAPYFPFATDVQVKVTIYVTDEAMVIDINDDYFYNYTHKQDFRSVDTFAIWFEGIQSSLNLFNVDMTFPSNL